MFRISHVLAALTASLLVSSAWAQTKPADDSIYLAWGQKAGIQDVMQDFVTRLQADARTGPFFKNANREHLITQLTEQLCQEAGGPCQYKGVPMDTAHADMGVGRRDFNALVEVLQQSMDAKAIPFAAQNGMLARLAPMHRQIVQKD